MEVSKNTLKAINSVFKDVRYYLSENIENKDAIEFCLEANRLYGYPEALQELMKIVKSIGYNETITLISEKLNLISKPLD